MTDTDLRLAVYDIDTGNKPLAVKTVGTGFAFAVASELHLSGTDGERRLTPGDGQFLDGSFEIAGAGWLFELAPIGQSLLEGAGTVPVLSHRIELDFKGPYILRADQVASNPGAQTPLHGHRGPGIRRLIAGRILATIGTTVECFEAGRAWYETGRDWVIGRNIHSGENIFVRVMVLPAELKGGKSSFVPANAEEADRPRSVNQRLLGEFDLGL